MDERLAAAWRVAPGYLAQHVLLSVCALALGFAISLPLAVAASRSAAVRWPSLFVASLIQTIPSLALLALFYPLLLALSALGQSWFGHGFQALGFLPSLLALTLYSMLPILRNGVDRHHGRRRRGRRSGARHGHDRPAAPAAGRTAAGGAGDHGGRANRGGVDDRRGDAGHPDRPDFARQLHLPGPADRELGVRAVRLRRRRPAWRCAPTSCSA